MSNGSNEGIAPNAKRLLMAGFMAILAAGIGFALRNGLTGEWKTLFRFTDGQVGLIGGAGFSGFCFGIIFGGIVVDKIGYGKLVGAAFLLHVLSAVVTLSPAPDVSQAAAFNLLFCGSFIFSLANGTLEAVANPLIATIYPKNRTHYLNILHASWPAGMILGAFVTLFLGEALPWKMKLGLYLIPTAIYGVMFLGQKFPKSEASSKGLSLGEMMKDVGILGASIVGVLLFLFFRDSLGGIIGTMFAAMEAERAARPVPADDLAEVREIIRSFMVVNEHRPEFCQLMNMEGLRRTPQLEVIMAASLYALIPHFSALLRR